MSNPTPLCYTKQLPTTPGYYWLKMGSDRPAQVVFVQFSNAGQLSCWFFGIAGYETSEYFQGFPKAKWAGPIREAAEG